MSWEYSEKKHTCPCEKGTYTETTGSNDWNQHSNDWKMDCPSCKSNYALYTYEYYRHGMRSKGYRWIKKQNYDKAMEFQNKVKQLKDNTVTLAKVRYLDTLVLQFEKSSKKAVWEVLHANIKSYKSLVTFYKHTKGRSKNEYLAEIFSDYHLNDVFKIIQVSDTEIEKLKNQEKNLENEAEKLLNGN